MPKYHQDKRNANKGTDRGRAALKQSLERLGAGRSVLVDKHGVAIAGNKTLEAAGELGLTKTVEVETDGSTLVVVKRTDLDLETDIKARELAFADNRVGELDLEWDPEVLKTDLEMLKSNFLDELWTPDDLGELFKPEGQEVTEDEPPIDKASELQAKWQVSPGDLWAIGDHRLICGDCTDKATVERLMNGKQANVIFTSPPYAMQRKDQYGGIETDKYVAWWEDVQANMRMVLADDGSFFVNIKPHCENGERVLYVFDLVLAMKRKWGWLFVDELCWVKTGMPGGYPNRFKNKFEPIYHFSLDKNIVFNPYNVSHISDEVPVYNKSNKNLHAHGNVGIICNEIVSGMAKPGNVINVNGTEGMHAAAFPIGLPTFFIKAYSESKDIILDPFMGSGTTLIAAHNENRIGFGIERLPKYCAVILERLSKLGLTPVKCDALAHPP